MQKGKFQSFLPQIDGDQCSNHGDIIDIQWKLAEFLIMGVGVFKISIVSLFVFNCLEVFVVVAYSVFANL